MRLVYNALVVLAVLAVGGGIGVYFWRRPAARPAAPAAPAQPNPREARLPLSLVARTPRNFADPAQIPETIRRLRSFGVQRVWVQLKQDDGEECTSGTVFYPSRVAPIAPGYGDDRLALWIDALSDAGIEVAGWFPCLSDTAAASAHPTWRARTVGPRGQVQDTKDWLCPGWEAVRTYQASVAAEAVKRYPKLHALYLDFVRYDSDFSCACSRCLKELDQWVHWSSKHRRPLRGADVLAAADERTPLWKAWIEMRARKISLLTQSVHTAVERVRPGLPLGACVLPFSATDYETNTEAGQDLRQMSLSGLGEIVLMGYWDDWEKSPGWVMESIKAAHELVREPCRLSVLLDGDMGVRATRLSLDAIDGWHGPIGYFDFWAWDERELTRLRRGVASYVGQEPMPKPEPLAVVVRIDTEPDYQDSYDAVSPKMIRQLLDLFDAEGIQATFITCGRLAELQTDAIRDAAARGHEIGVHAYNHEHLDTLPRAEQIAIIDKSMETFARLGIPVVGFGAPANSITETARDRLIEWNLAYDGSASYDPPGGLVVAGYANHTDNQDARILVIPYVEPNDWDARYEEKMTAAQMLAAWKERLDRVIALGEPCFVLDLHQWIACREDNLAAVRAFIRHVKAKPGCRLMTLRQAAQQVRAILDRTEPPMPTSGDDPPPLRRPPAPPVPPAPPITHHRSGTRP